MAYIRIPELPPGGQDAIPPVSIHTQKDWMVLEQDITRKIHPLDFLSHSLPQLTVTSNVDGTYSIPVVNTVDGDGGSSGTAQNLTVQNLLNYFKKHWVLINETFYVSADDINASDVNDSPERGKNEELPYRTIKRAAKAISDAMALDTGNVGVSAAGGADFASPPRSKKQYTIMVRSGDYSEITPIFLPPNTSMIGDNLRRTTIRPAAGYEYNDMFWVSSACYIWGFTFRGHRSRTQIVPSQTVIQDPTTGNWSQITKNVENITGGSAAIAFPVCTNLKKSSNTAQYDIAYNTVGYEINSTIVPTNRPYIYTSPYVQGCTSYSIPTRDDGSGNIISDLDRIDNGSIDPATGQYGYGNNNAGTGMRIDGSLVDGPLRSMVLDSFTQVNQGGRGIHLLNHGYAQVVSIFTIATKEGILAETGGSCSVSTSNSTFGLSGLIARGKSPDPVLTGTFTVAPPADTYTTVDPPFGFKSSGNLFTIKNITPQFINLDNLGNGQQVAKYPYTNMCFTVGSDSEPWLDDQGNSNIGYILDSDISLNGQAEPKLFFVEITPTKNTKLNAFINDPNTVAYDILLNFNIPLNLKNLRGINFTNAPVKFYVRSMVETGSHTFEFIGTGTRMYYAIPSSGGVADNTIEAVFDAGVPNLVFDTNHNYVPDPTGAPTFNINSNLPGIVYYTSSNELGDFKVGPSFKILQSTGTIDGDTFKRAILTLVTPLNIVLE
jgi:hypothetical protein